MLRSIHPYHLILLGFAIGALAMAKINKLSFYHHYFKVIEEVEVRNSQAVPAIGLSQLLTDSFRHTLDKVSRIMSSLLLPASAVQLLSLAPSHSPFHTQVWPRLSARLYHRFHPTLAP
jgi:hypothetical protein